jgi:FixJ family two-component response regulator
LKKTQEQPVILITAHGDINTAVEAMKISARYFITKPIEYSRLKAILEDIDLFQHPDLIFHQKSKESGRLGISAHSSVRAIR